MKITTEHSRSSYGIPVILDDRGEVLDYAPGIVSVRNRLRITQQQLAEACGVTVHAVRNWEQGRRNVDAAALNVMGAMLRRVDVAEK